MRSKEELLAQRQRFEDSKRSAEDRLKEPIVIDHPRLAAEYQEVINVCNQGLVYVDYVLAEYDQHIVREKFLKDIGIIN